jgi:hypothetical protein
LNIADSWAFMKVSDGTRTHDRLDHNQELYQLSYAHRGKLNLPLPVPRDRTSPTIGACIESGRERELNQLRVLVEAPVDLMSRYLPGMVERRRGAVATCTPRVSRRSAGEGGGRAKPQDASGHRLAVMRLLTGSVSHPDSRWEDDGMDTSTIDQNYQQLHTEFQNVANSIQTLAQKLQAAAQAGDTTAREWLLDLKQIALDVKDEQIQVNGLLQAIHSFVDNSHQQLQQQVPQYQQVQYQPAPQQMGGGMFGGGGGGGGGMLGGLLNSGFGRAMEVGAGIGLGEDLINSIF